MVPSLISFDREYRSRPFQVMKTEIGRLKLLDGQPGDLNKNQKAIGADLGSERLDAVLLGGDSNGSVVQMVTQKNGSRVVSLVDIPLENGAYPAGGTAPLMSGFEISETVAGLRGVFLEASEQVGVTPSQYKIVPMTDTEARNALVRAKTVLASFEVDFSTQS